MISQHYIYIPFTGVGLKQYGGDEWFTKRIEIFKNFTFKSLFNQSVRDFVLWISFRPEEEENSLTKELELYIRSKGVECVFTFDSLMYHDDRFVQQNETLKTRLTKSLRILENISKKSPDHYTEGQILVTRIDSDDMLRHDAVLKIRESANEYKCGSVLLWRGLIYNAETEELAEWLPRTNPPFHSIVFDKNEFFDADLHLGIFDRWKSHEDTPIFVTPSVIVPFDNLYCVVVHNPQNHISTSWNHSFRGDIVDDPKLLNSFGI